MKISKSFVWDFARLEIGEIIVGAFSSQILKRLFFVAIILNSGAVEVISTCKFINQSIEDHALR